MASSSSFRSPPGRYPPRGYQDHEFPPKYRLSGDNSTAFATRGRRAGEETVRKLRETGETMDKKKLRMGQCGLSQRRQRGHAITRSAQVTATARPPRRKDGATCCGKISAERPAYECRLDPAPYVKLT